MGMTMTEKILAAKCNKSSVKAGELILATVDLTMANDVTAPVAIKEFEKAGLDKIFDKDKIAFILDHFTPNKDINSATLCQITREFSKKHNITHFYEGGNVGIEHALIPELGLALPGELIIGADSHTCTYGALNAFSTGVGSTDMAVSMATGKVWLKVPEAIKINITGKFNENVSGKDLILHIIGLIGVDGALYKSLEFTGSGIKNLTMDDRFTISNMAIEAGAKNGIFPCDEITLSYISKTALRPYIAFEADEDAIYTREINVNLSELKATVAFPHLPENTKNIDEAEKEKIKINQVVIGSCTNGRYSDLYNAAMYLKGKKVSKDVRTIIIPATPKVYKEALLTGLLEIFLDAGCIISAPTCGPCLGGHMGILAKGERAVATTNRNFVGRMGHPESEVYLASPVVAAASAVKGYIAKP